VGTLNAISDLLGGNIDRRVRIRPKSGISSLYYGGLLGGIIADPNSIRQNLLSQALGDATSSTNWLSTSPLANQSPNAPNFYTQALNGNLSVSNIAQDFIPGLGASTPSNPLAGVEGIVSNSLTYQLFGAAPQILAPLAQTNGLVYPYTPTIDYSQAVEYNSYDPVHTNQELHSYVRTKAPTINVNGKFSVQNSDEASYAIAAIHFCRTVTKMAFGNSTQAGTPPPVLLFDAYGEYQFHSLNVIMTNFSVEYPSDVDYVKVNNSNSYVPSLFNLSISLTVQNTPDKLRSFSLEQFRSGLAMKQGGWI